MYNFDLIKKIEANYHTIGIDRTISPSDTMQNEWYFDVGRSAVEIVKLAIMSSFLPQIDRVLDIPSGHGRVLRHLKAMFPEATIHASDVDKEGLDFCASTFGVTPVYSEEELTRVTFPIEYDLIWVGSLFSHTSLTVTSRWMKHLSKFLTPKGIIVATFQGRWGLYMHKIAPYIEEKSWDKILVGFNQTGYGYANYKTEENHAYLVGSYGVSLAKPSTICSIIESIPGVRIYNYMERAWADHQDVVVFGKPAINAKNLDTSL